MVNITLNKFNQNGQPIYVGTSQSNGGWVYIFVYNYESIRYLNGTPSLDEQTEIAIELEKYIDKNTIDEKL